MKNYLSLLLLLLLAGAPAAWGQVQYSVRPFWTAYSNPGCDGPIFETVNIAYGTNSVFFRVRYTLQRYTGFSNS
ncbi:MAG: hypothetical protein D6722_00565 [Bacteroidetes bacterium]|nr:MAG: hypothetical protein D6722_00565 [Bacteroidota bacterium]